MCGTMSGSYRLDDVFVPEEFSGRREDPSLRREPGRPVPIRCRALHAVGVAGVAIGIARAMLDGFDRTWRPGRRRAISAARRQRGGAVEGRANGGATAGARHVPIWAEVVRHLGSGRSVGDRRAVPGARAAGLRVRHPDSRGGGGSAGPMPTSSAPHSSGGSVTSTHCRSILQSRTPRILNRWDRSCSAFEPPGRSCRQAAPAGAACRRLPTMATRAARR